MATSRALVPGAGARSREGIGRRMSQLLSIDPADWAGSLLEVVLRVLFVLGAFVYVPSVYLAITDGLTGIAVVDTMAIVTLGALVMLRGLPFRLRAGVLCAVCYMLGAGLLLWVGPICQIYLFAFTVLTGMLLGRRAGIYACLLSAATLMLVGSSGYAASEMSGAAAPYSFAGWTVITLNFALIAVLLNMATAAVLAALHRGLMRETEFRVSLAQERNLLRTLIDSMPDLVYTKDRDARFVAGNNAMLSLMGVEDEDQLRGKTVFDFFPEDVCEPYHVDDLQVLATGVTTRHEERSIDPSGTPRWFLTIKAPLRGPSGEVEGLVGVSRDITHSRNIEAQLRQAQKMEAFGQLAGGVAHDFNNLLTIISGCSEELLSISDLNATARESVTDIRVAGERATSLTRQLLSFSRQGLLQPQVLDPNVVVAETGKMLRRLIAANVQFVTALAPAIDWVSVDPGQLSQIIVNLAVNARDAMSGGGTLTIATGNVILGDDFAPTHLPCTPGRHVMITVTDTGGGMTADTMARMFEPFYTTKGVGQGTGLGLSMVLGIVQQGAGTIHVTSVPGVGTSFAVYFPAVSNAPLSGKAFSH
jgi:PAS domain S-box-containing protein